MPNSYQYSTSSQFQFIATTTTSPEELSRPPYVVLELAPGADEALLFKQQLAPELPGGDLG